VHDVDPSLEVLPCGQEEQEDLDELLVKVSASQLTHVVLPSLNWNFPGIQSRHAEELGNACDLPVVQFVQFVDSLLAAIVPGGHTLQFSEPS
jgi:hypothetical protein